MPIVIGPCSFLPSEACTTCGKSYWAHIVKLKSPTLAHYTPLQWVAARLLRKCK